MKDRQTSRVDQIVDLLAEEIAERIRIRGDVVVVPPESPATEPPEPETVSPAQQPIGLAEAQSEGGRQPPSPETASAQDSLPPAPGPPHAARLMGRLALGLLVILLLINIPLNRHGTTLATAMPDSAALIIRDGLVVKQEGHEAIYILQDDQFRWISSMDAFKHLGLTWEDVHIVDEGFLAQFETGPPVHVLLKCWDSPHVYRLEGGLKRWITSIQTFEAEGHVWEDVRMVTCDHLRGLPDGDTIPPDQGPPPQP